MYNKIKRLLDIVFSILLILLLFIPMCIISVLIKLSGSDKVIYKSKRIGKNEKVFNLYKFRTMTLAREHLDLDTVSENKVTTIGKILRITSIDEIPQLFNVLKGDMSFIGPRPLIPEFLEYFSDNDKKRFKVLPGMSGYAQINGRNAISTEEKIKLDLYYVENISFNLDFRIFLKTFYCVLQHKNADISEKDLITEIKLLRDKKNNS